MRALGAAMRSAGLLVLLAVAGYARAAQPSPKLAAVTSAEPLRIADDHAGPITKKTPCTEEAIRALFPGQAVKATRYTPGDVAGEFKIAIVVDGRAWVDCSGDQIESVAIRSAAFLAPGGRRVGQTWAALHLQVQDCAPYTPMLPYAEAITCRTPDDKALAYWVAFPRFDLGTADRPPTIRYEKGRLYSITWRPRPR